MDDYEHDTEDDTFSEDEHKDTPIITQNVHDRISLVNIVPINRIFVICMLIGITDAFVTIKQWFSSGVTCHL